MVSLEQGFCHITYEEYEQLPEYPDILSYSGLKMFADRSPLHFRKGYKGIKSEKTPDFIYGDLVHERVLQGINHVDVFADGVKTKESKVWDKRQEDILESERMIRDYEASSLILSVPNNQYELTGFLREPEFGFWMTYRSDVINHDRRVIADLKTTIDASYKKFQRDIANLKYHWQAAFYVLCTRILTGYIYDFVWIVVEKKPPFAVAVYQASDDMLIRAHEQMMPHFERFATCLEEDRWPAFSETEDIETIDLPTWA